MKIFDKQKQKTIGVQGEKVLYVSIRYRQKSKRG